MPEGDGAAAAGQWLRQLNPDLRVQVRGSGRPLAPASRPTRVAAATERFGADPVAWAVAVGWEMADLIIREMPEFGGGLEEFDTLRMGTESSVLDSMAWLDGKNRERAPIPDEAIEGDVVFVRRRIPLDRVLRGVRLGHSIMARTFLEACTRLVSEKDRPEQMKWISDALFAYIDNFSDRMAVAYAEELDRWSASAAAVRAELVRRLLAGDLSTGEAEIGRELRYDVSTEHLGLALWLDPAKKGPASADLEAAARELLHQAGARQILIHQVGGTRMWAWGNRTGFPNRLDLEVPSTIAGDVRVAIGVPGKGVEGFRQTHQQASDAERTARASAGAVPRLTFYADVAIPTLLSADTPAMRDFVLRELGPLARDTPAEATLRETLLCYLEEESSPQAAAQRLFVARNTISYRIRRASELLGYDIGERRFQLQTALVLARQFGSAVLSEQ